MNQRILKVSPSKLNLIQACSRASNYSALLGYVQQRKPTYMIKGEVAHKGLEHFYSGLMKGGDKSSLINESIQLIRDEIAQTQIEVQEGEDMVLTMKDYFAYYPDDHLEILEVEKAFCVPLFENDELMVLIEGKIDLVAKHKTFDRNLVIDHKTGEQFSPPSMLDNQFAAYSLVSNTPDFMENKIVWGRPKKSKFDPSTKFHRTLIQYTPEFLEDWRQNTLYWILKFDEEIKQDYFPANFKSCRFCQFKKVCEWPDEEMRRSKLDLDFIKAESFDLFEEG